MSNIMFDLYGTLIDIHTEEGNITFWNKLAKRTISYKRYSGKALKKMYFQICNELQQLKEEIEILDVFQKLYNVDVIKAKKIAGIFRRFSTKYVCLYSGVKNLLLDLKNKGYRLFVLSNAQASFTIPELKRLGIYDLFDGIAISSDYGYKKPNILFYKNAMNNFGVEACNTWMIGNDYECDILPAKNLGLKTIFIESNLTPLNNINEKIKGFSKDKIINILSIN